MQQRTVRRRGGAQNERKESSAAPAPDPDSPLDFATSVYRDASQPMALRASMAKAALPYLNKRNAEEESSEDAREKRPWPFNMPDPYGAIRPDWRHALEKAGLIPSAEERYAALQAQGRHPLLAPRDARADDTLRTALEQRDAAQARAGAMEERALAAEAALEEMREAQDVARAHVGVDGRDMSGQGDADIAQGSDAPAQLVALREKLRAAEEKARDMEARWRRAEMQAHDMEQRALATEAILQRGR